VLTRAAEVTSELSRLEAEHTSETVKTCTQEIIALCQAIRVDMKVPLAGVTENTHLTNNLSIYGARKELEIAHLRTKMIHDLLLQYKNGSKPAPEENASQSGMAMGDEMI
jgi:hypothetical protein